MNEIAAYENAQCRLFNENSCRSCTLLALPPGKRVAHKLDLVEQVLGRFGIRSTPANPVFIPSSPWASRYKIKMSVSGEMESPRIGVLTREYTGVDLVECRLPPPQVRDLLLAIRKSISAHALAPYSVTSRTGWLKGIIILLSKAFGEGLVRFVVKDSGAVAHVRKMIPALQEEFPWLKVVSCNIQPIPAAILEGPEEVLLSCEERITEQYGSLSLSFGPKSFMQVSPEVAAALYDWVETQVRHISPKLVLDLFCGVGGFALSASPWAKEVLGVELSEDAVAAARHNAVANKRPNTRFEARDLTKSFQVVSDTSPSLVIVNPPRRGLGADLCDVLNTTPSVNDLVYSSCNPQSLAVDLTRLASCFKITDSKMFDMFPLTEHMEVGVRMQRV